MAIVFKKSPNFDKKTRAKRHIKIIVFHYTGMQSEVAAIKRLTNSRSKVSCHYLINEKGNIFRMVLDNHVAWHAGTSNWGKFSSLNKYSIGIELVNSGHGFNYKKFKRKQILSLIKLTKKLISKYNIKKKNIVGHSDIAPSRKKDPGEKFPWKLLAKSGIGFWHNLSQKKLASKRRKKLLEKDRQTFFKNLIKIGFKAKFNLKKNSYEKKLIDAFQRRFRPQLISGIVDEECFFIAKNLCLKGLN